MTTAWFARTWAVARYELRWDLRKKRTYIILGLFLFAAFVFAYLLPSIAGKSITESGLLNGVSLGSDLWWVNVHSLVNSIEVSGVFPLLIGGFIAADSLASEFDSGTIVPLLSQPVRRAEVYAGKLLGKILLLMAISVLFTLLVVVGSEISVGVQSHLEMIPLLVFAEFGTFLEYTALAFLFGSLARSGSMVLGILVATSFLILSTMLALSLRFGEQEAMFLLPMVNVDFLLKVVPYYVFQPWGVMVLQGGFLGNYTPPVAITVVSGVEYAVAGLSANVVVALLAGYYFFKNAEVRG